MHNKPYVVAMSIFAIGFTIAALYAGIWGSEILFLIGAVLAGWLYWVAVRVGKAESFARPEQPRWDLPKDRKLIRWARRSSQGKRERCEISTSSQVKRATHLDRSLNFWYKHQSKAAVAV